MRVRTSMLAAILALQTVSQSQAQSKPETRPEFAVTSVKLTKEQCCVTYGVGIGAAGGKLVTLKMLIALAYRVQQFQISGGPKWIGSDRFDVEGKAENPKAGNEQVRQMLQSLLEYRFRLKMHRETKPAFVYALVVAKNGPKLKRSVDQTSPDVNGPPLEGAGPNRGVLRVGSGNMVGNAVPFSRFATVLSQHLDRLVVDRTNLSGRFDIQLKWALSQAETVLTPGGNPVPRDIIGNDGETLSPDLSGPSIFSAVQEQLGLKLESAKAPVELLVIDRVERLSPN